MKTPVEKILLVAVVVFGVALASAEPIRSMLGGKETGEVSEDAEVVNPYITDGLVAMWDGVWNVSIGRHSNTITAWKDLVGGEVLQVTDGFFVSSGFSGTSEILANAVLVDAENSHLKSVISGFNATVEFISTPLGISIYGDGGYGVNTPFDMYGIYRIYAVSNGSIVDWYRCHSFVNRVSDAVDIGIPISFSCISEQATSTYGRGILYANGTRRSSSLYTPQNPQSTFSVGYKGIVHCIRIYNRKLSPEEIEFNYQIDEERFGL